VTEPDPAAGPDLVTAYSYDGLNHMTQVSMPRQEGPQTRTFTYDSVTQRLAAVQTPESGTVTYAYNADGTVQSKTDAKGQVIRYTYETYGRVSQTDAYPAGASVPDACQTVYYTYDTATLCRCRVIPMTGTH
jgi:YD repeat-containing protein